MGPLTFAQLILEDGPAAISFVEFLTEADDSVERDPSKWSFAADHLGRASTARCGDARMRFQQQDSGEGIVDVGARQWMSEH